MPRPRTEEKECPRCGTKQPMPRRLRPAGDDKDWMVEFWSCRICPWERIGRQTTPEIEMLAGQLRQAARRRQYELTRHGQPSNSTIELSRRLRKRYSAHVSELGAKVRAHGA